ncbi:MAG: YfhO family protein [Acidimicrobiia bacterium]|nr:YfhO family protein [Acidimicrobiia bacterium]
MSEPVARETSEEPVSSAEVEGEERRRSLWFLVPILVPIAVFLDGLVGRRLYAPGDAFQFELPLRVLAARLIRDGSLPTWNSFAFSGTPLLATGQVAVFYPPNWLYVALPFVLAHNLTVVITFVIAATGAYALAKRLTGDDVAAVIASLAFGLNGFFFGHVVHPAMIASAAWLPWMLWAFDRARERPTPGRMAVTSLSVGMLLLAGHSQIFAFGILVLGIYAAVTATGDGRDWWRGLVTAGACVILGACLAAIQLVPTLAILQDTDRASLSYEEAVTYSYSPSQLPLLVFPFAYGSDLDAGPYGAPGYTGKWNPGELNGYLGVVALVLCGAGIVAARRDRRAVALLVIGGVALLIALADTTPAGRLVHALPVYGQLRSWARYIVGTGLSVSVFAAYGLVELRARSRRRRRGAAMRAVAVGGLLLVVALLLTVLPAFDPYLTAGRPLLNSLAIPALFTVGAIAAVIWLVLARPEVSRRLAVGLICALVGVDALVSYGWFTPQRTSAPTPSYAEALFRPGSDPSWGGVADVDGDPSRWIFVGSDISTAGDWVNSTVPAGNRGAVGYDPLAPAAYIDTLGMTYYGGLEETEWVSAGAPLLDLLRISTIVRDPETEHLLGTESGVVSEEVLETGAIRYVRNPSLPAAWLVGATEIMPVRDAAEAVRSTEMVFDPAEEAIVQATCRGCPSGPKGATGEVTVKSWRGGEIRLDAIAERDSYLVVSEAWFPGWSATVDGEAVPVGRTDAVLLGLPLPKGRYEVVLGYQPPGLPLGASISAFTVLGLGAWIAARAITRRRARADRA